MSSLPYRRLRGRLIWLDLVRKSNMSRELADVETAILRPNELRLQFMLDGASYEVSLSKESDGVHRGRWERGRPQAVEQHGEAECRLEEGTEGLDGGVARAIDLKGRWLEDIDWGWFGRFEFV